MDPLYMMLGAGGLLALNNARKKIKKTQTTEGSAKESDFESPVVESAIIYGTRDDLPEAFDPEAIVEEGAFEFALDGDALNELAKKLPNKQEIEKLITALPPGLKAEARKLFGKKGVTHARFLGQRVGIFGRDRALPTEENPYLASEPEWGMNVFGDE